MPNPYLVVGTPCFGGLVGHGYMMSYVRLAEQAAGAGFRVAAILLGHDSLVSRARNTIVARFLDNPDTTHLLFVDADISFTPEQVVRMLRFDRDVVAGLYPVKTIDWERMAARAAETGETMEQAGLGYVGQTCTGAELRLEDRFATGHYAGAGFLLIKRAVFARLFAAYPETRYRSAHVVPRPSAESPNQYALFDCLIEPETGAYLSEDYAFCRRWRAIGGEIWLDLDSRLTHSGVHDFNGNAAARFRRAIASHPGQDSHSETTERS